jgi:hypothetical protein
MTGRWLRPLTVAALVVVPLVAITPAATATTCPTTINGIRIHCMTVRPHTGLVGGQRVRVHSQHYKPYATVAVSMCRPRIRHYSDCDSSTTMYVRANKYGSWTFLRYPVKKYLHLGDGTSRTCNRRGNCAIGAASPIPKPTDASVRVVYFKG